MYLDLALQFLEPLLEDVLALVRRTSFLPVLHLHVSGQCVPTMSHQLFLQPLLVSFQFRQSVTGMGNYYTRIMFGQGGAKELYLILMQWQCILQRVIMTLTLNVVQSVRGQPQ